jgi:hypothetical protein
VDQPTPDVNGKAEYPEEDKDSNDCPNCVGHECRPVLGEVSDGLMESQSDLLELGLVE